MEAMKRDPALLPLTHDHHHALRQARALRLAAGVDEAARLQVAREFLTFFRGEIVTHFREEEELLFPLLVNATGGVPDLLMRVLAEHAQIHAIALRLTAETNTGSAQATLVLEAAEHLEAHIRGEERELFPLIERVVPVSALSEVKFEPRVRTDPGSVSPNR